MLSNSENTVSHPIVSPRLIGLTAFKTSGKDAFAESFVAAGYVQCDMCTPMKAMLAALYISGGMHPRDATRKLHGDLKDEPCEVLGGSTPRDALKLLGSAGLLGDINPAIVVQNWRHRATELLAKGHRVICTDVRRLDQADAVSDLGGFMIRLIRPKAFNSDPHPTESESPFIPVDYTVMNTGDLSDLSAQARQLIFAQQQAAE